jgi:hypothetical protein
MLVNPCRPQDHLSHISSHKLSLSSFCIEDWAFYHWDHLLIVIYFQYFISLQTIHLEHQNYCILFNVYLSKLLTNTFSSSWVQQPFYWKVLQLISCTWEPSGHFSGTVAGECSAMGKWYRKEIFIVFYFLLFASSWISQDVKLHA